MGRGRSRVRMKMRMKRGSWLSGFYMNCTNFYAGIPSNLLDIYNAVL